MTLRGQPASRRVFPMPVAGPFRYLKMAQRIWRPRPVPYAWLRIKLNSGPHREERKRTPGPSQRCGHTFAAITLLELPANLDSRKETYFDARMDVDIYHDVAMGTLAAAMSGGAGQTSGLTSSLVFGFLLVVSALTFTLRGRA
jgi:hypothetical protein